MMAGAALLVTACDRPLSALNPAGPAASQIGHLGRVMLASLGLVWIGMVVLVLAVMLRPRAFARVGLRTWLIVGGLVLPLSALVPLFLWSVVLTGRLMPPLDSEGGRGVYLVNQLCDLVQLRSSDAGTTVRVLTWRLVGRPSTPRSRR